MNASIVLAHEQGIRLQVLPFAGVFSSALPSFPRFVPASAPLSQKLQQSSVISQESKCPPFNPSLLPSPCLSLQQLTPCWACISSLEKVIAQHNLPHQAYSPSLAMPKSTSQGTGSVTNTLRMGLLKEFGTYSQTKYSSRRSRRLHHQTMF